MSSTARLSLIALFVAGMTGAVYADLSPTLLPVSTSLASRSSDSQATDANVVATEALVDLGLNLWSRQFDVASALTGSLGEGIPDGSVQSADQVARQIDPLPSSLSLFLSAMLSLGGFHLVRSPRYVHLGALPEWYHTGAPAQIGHAVSFDFNYAPTVLRVFESVASGVEERPVWREHWRELDLRRYSQIFLHLADPRGPPVVS